MNNPPEIAVVGAGVIGLSTSVRLLSAGFAVVIYAEAITPNTTSNVAGAYWYPYAVGLRRQIETWAFESYQTYQRMAENSVSGVHMRTLLKLLGPQQERPWWIDWVRDFVPEAPAKYPLPYAHGHRMMVPLIEPPVHLSWLLSIFRDLGGRIVRRRITNLGELTKKHRLTVCCAGLGARTLVQDPLLRPVKGQVLRLTRPNNLEPTLLSWTSEPHRAYVIPRSQDVILGGTYEPGAEDTEVSLKQLTLIRTRCQLMAPELARAQILGAYAGLRPVRLPPRLELAQQSKGRAIIYNYGHGSSGFTLAWGCANSVTLLAKDFMAL